MPRIDYNTCEPFRAWNRLEPRTRKTEFDRVLRSDVHDPLWMLTRQWQFGEFAGEDTGSPIFAKIKFDTTRITQVQLGQAPVQPYSEATPLETLVESEPMAFDFRARALAGRQWAKLFDRHVGPLLDAGQRASYHRHFGEQFPFVLLPVSDADEPNLTVAKARLQVNTPVRQFVQSVQGRVADGVQLFNNLRDNLNATLALLLLEAAHATPLKVAITDFMSWFERQFQLVTSRNTAWNPAQLEYQFGCSLPEPNAGPPTVLTANEYYTGHLDWYTVDVNRKPDPLSGLAQAANPEVCQTQVLTVLPKSARFAGMPAPRWWEFEDGAVDLGNINADTTDLAKILMVEYALMYGNDWFIVPFGVRVGTLASVPGLVVTDVFGQRTYVRPALQGQTDDWNAWGMFNLSTARSEFSEQPLPADTRLFIPPATYKTQEGEPLEKVHFVRDEMANMVWALEATLPDHLGNGQDAHAAATALSEFLAKRNGPAPAPPTDVNARLHFTLGNTVPENWIPFMPVHIPGQNRAIRLQRASMPRLFGGSFQAIRPQSDILRVGMTDSTPDIAPFVNPSAHLQAIPYFVNEEEITRTGCRVAATQQRSRWYGGEVVNWYGRRKTVGRGEGSSGLRFDNVTFTKKEEPGA